VVHHPEQVGGDDGIGKKRSQGTWIDSILQIDVQRSVHGAELNRTGEMYKNSLKL